LENKVDTLSLPFDLYSRNFLISEGINAFRKKSGKEHLKILDIGGRNGKLELFLNPGDEVTLLDIREGDEPNLIVGDATDMQMFSDGEFDIVTSGDVLEHVSVEKRKDFIRESLRVSKGMTIFAGPLDEKGVKESEEYVNQLYKELMGEDHDWLKEHFENGLPDKAMLEKEILQLGYNYFSIPSNNLDTWRLLQMLYFSELKVAKRLHKEYSKKLFEKFNSNLKTFENPAKKFYRNVFFVTKDDFSFDFKYKFDQEAYEEFVDEVMLALSNVIRDVENEWTSLVKNKEEQIEGKEGIIQKSLEGLELKDSQIEELKKISEHKDGLLEEKEAIIQKSLEGVKLKDEQIEEKDVQIQEKDIQIQEKDVQIQEKDIQIQEKDEFKKKLDELIEAKENYIRGIEPGYLAFLTIQKSLSYKIIYKLERLITKIFWEWPIFFFKKVMKGFRILRSQGVKEFFKHVRLFLTKGTQRNDMKNSPHTLSLNEQYQLYLEENNFSEKDMKRIQKECEDFDYQPKISIITPVYNVEPEFLDKCIESVVNQFYSNWEFVLHDDASPNEETKACLRKWAENDERIVVSFGKKNQHISGASNSALKLATGDFVGLLDHDDELTPNALYECVKLLQDNPEIDFMYSDEDKIEVNGELKNPFFKPDFSPDLFHSVNYICHFSLMRKEIGDRIGWFRKGYEGAQDFDLFLRFTSETKNIVHIPKILYHWRMLETSTAKSIDSKNYAHEAGENALRDYLQKNYIDGRVTQGLGPTNYRINYPLPKDALVSIIIPFKDKAELLKTCVESILKKTTYQNYELILISNNSSEKALFDYLDELKKRDNVHVYEYNKPFNYAEINNWGAKKTNGEFLVLLNNDTEVITEGWIEEMLGNANRKEVGAVGPMLLFPNKTIQHAGVTLGMTGLAGHIFARQFPEQTYYSLANFRRNCLAVTAACLMVKKDKYFEVGGLNEKFTVCGNDVDLCLNLYEKGYLNVYTPYAKLYHYESMTRDPYAVPECDFEVSRTRYKPYLDHNDPYYNPNLSLKTEQIELNINS